MKTILSAILISLATVTVASAQVNCGIAGTPQMRAWCYQQSAQIYRQESQMYNNIARQQWQQYQNAPRYIQPLRVIPGAGPLVGAATQAWRAPGYYYQYRYGRP